MKNFALALAAASSVALIAGSAPANAYTMDDAGRGWVGKGEVQTAFGINNAAMQRIHEGVTFSYQSTARYSQDCEKEVGGEKQTRTIENTFSKTVSIDAAVASDSRKTGQWTGWYLTGFGATSGSNTVPADLCTPGVGEGEDNNGWVPADGSAVTVVPGSQSGGLYANHANYGSRLLTVTPTV